MFWTVLFVLLLAASIGAWIYWSKAKAEPMSRKEFNERQQKLRDESRSSYELDEQLRALQTEYDVSRQVGKYKRPVSLVVAILMMVLALWVGIANTFTTIPTKDIGVKTTFGAPTGYLPNGPHFKLPWEDVTLMDGAIQTDTHNKVADHEDCIKVRIAHQIVACANTYVKWQVNESSVDSLFQNYRVFDAIRDSLVTKNLQSVLNEVFAQYDPLSVDAKTGQSNAPELAVLSKQALDKVRAAVGNNINVHELAVTVLNYDDATQQKINALQGQVAQTRIAEQSIETAKKQAEANNELAKSVSQDPNVLVSKCLDMVAEGKVTLPAGFSCWPGSGSAVVVPSAK